MKRFGGSPTRVMKPLSVPAVEDAFMRIAVDVQSLISLDGIDELPGHNGFRIRIHDSYGPLPDVQVQDLENGSPLLEQIETEAAKLRDDIDKLWEKVTRIEVLNTKLDNIEKNVDEIKEMIKDQKRN